MLLSEAIEALAVATLANGRSPATVEGYRRKLAPLLSFLGDVDIAGITVHDLRRFVADLRTRSSRYASGNPRPEVPGGLAAASVATHVRAVKRLFAFLLEEEVTTTNPARRLQLPKVGRGEPKSYEPADFARLLAATAGTDPENLRDRALLLFLADTGCRLGGLVGLRIEDLDFDHGLATVTEKGAKSRMVPFSPPTAAALQAWLAVRPDVGTPAVWVSLGNRSQGAMTGEGVRMVLRRLKQQSGIKGPCNPHSFRHGFARQYLQSGGDLASLADLLGHSSVEVTWRHYAIFRTSELAEKHAKHSPIAKMGREGEL